MSAPVNFSKRSKLQQNQRSGFILVVLLLLLIWLASQYGQSQSVISPTKSQLAAPTKTQQRVLTAEEQQQAVAADVLIDQLNTPWLLMLNDLELVIAEVPNVYFTQLLPDSRASQILISGQADTLTPLLDLMKRLESLPAFKNVLLVQQKHLDGVPARIGFTLKLGWNQNG